MSELTEQQKMDAINNAANTIYNIEQAVKTEIAIRKNFSEKWMKKHLEWKEKYFQSVHYIGDENV